MIAMLVLYAIAAFFLVLVCFLLRRTLLCSSENELNERKKGVSLLIVMPHLALALVILLTTLVMDKCHSQRIKSLPRIEEEIRHLGLRQGMHERVVQSIREEGVTDKNAELYVRQLEYARKCAAAISEKIREYNTAVADEKKPWANIFAFSKQAKELQPKGELK